MTSRVLTIVLATGLFFSALYLATRAGTAHIPGNQQDYEPVQPIAYSHRLHADRKSPTRCFGQRGCSSARSIGRRGPGPPTSLAPSKPTSRYNLSLIRTGYT